jgi:hypothetical protein
MAVFIAAVDVAVFMVIDSALDGVCCVVQSSVDLGCIIVVATLCHIHRTEARLCSGVIRHQKLISQQGGIYI